MDTSLSAALDYIPRWIEHQMRLTEQPGCVIAVAKNGQLVFEQAFGHADLATGSALTPRHRFRVASHSKSFTAAGVLKLREQGRLRLDDRIGAFVSGLHPRVAEVTLAQLLSHSAGLVRDGADAGQWSDRREFLDEAGLRESLAAGLVIAPNTRFKYSNHGYGLVGMAIEAITGERYADWIACEIVGAAGLKETIPDAPPAGLAPDVPFARGHSAKHPLGHRVVIPGANPTRALAAATGFISTAADLARFFASLSPAARKSVLSPESRREMTRRQWQEPHASAPRWYGLGTISGTLADWDWCGHSGGFQGTITRTATVPAQGLTVSVLTNAADGLSHAWLEGALHILRAYALHGAPSRETKAWAGRWWSLWGAIDLLPMAGKVLVATPAALNPLLDASEIAPERRERGSGTEHGRIVLAGGFMSHGEPARLVRDARGKAMQVWLGGTMLQPEAKAAKELAKRYVAAL